MLESRKNPVIVTGHTRVEACKRLGWTEIPDEHIAFCDGLAEDQIKAYRLADNKTAEIAKWNIGLLKSELKSLGGKSVDLSKLGFDLKSKSKPYGTERLRTDGAYNLDKVARDDCAKGGFPSLPKVDARPADLMGFNYAKTAAADAKRRAGCHFFLDDYQFERLWNRPDAYIDLLRGFSCVLTPDFSLYMDMPDPMQRWNAYRSRALGLWWSRQGIEVVPTLTWAQPSTYPYCFGGLPKHSTVAVSTVGVKGDAGALAIWNDGMREAMRRLEPARVLLYGGNVVYQTEFGDLKALPQIGIMKQASAEIRQLNKQLGIADGGDGREAATDGGNVLELVQGRRRDRARAAGA